MSVLERVQHDVKDAMKAGERERVHALRLIVNELQKAEKDAAGDDLAVLQRERKRRLEAAEAYRDGGRTELAEAEEREAEIISSYMPEQVSDEELARDRRRRRGRVRRHLTAGARQGDGARDAEGQGQGGWQARLGRGQGEADAVVRVQLELSNEVAAELAGPGDLVMRTLEGHLDCDMFLRGNVLTLDGEDEAVAMGRTVVRELSDLVRQGHEIAPGTIEAITGALDRHESPSRILEDVVWRHRGLKVAPKTVNQKRYVDAIRRSTITVGVGPAGTGKSFLAVAMAVAALSRREVNRIVLTRPAVEAGERLGFLPGDIAAKVDPYLRPLFDALYDMLEPERVNQHLDRGVIEIAPLAFMRGRAQPLDRQVLTPSGFRPIGSLRVGDLVTGSDGRPTPVLGVYPQGRREIFRVRAQDGASTLCCAEHLWFVTTPDDRRHGKPGRVRADRGDDWAPAAAPPAPLRAAADERAGAVRAARAAAGSVRPGPLARRWLPYDVDDAKLHDGGPGARRTRSKPLSPESSCVARTPSTTSCGMSMDAAAA